MNHFPDPLPPPETVPYARTQRKQNLVRAARWGICLRLTIILIELGGFYLFSSSALLMDAVASVLDILSSFILILCIRFAARPPDTNHPFGHGRFEPLAGLQLGVLLLVIGAGAVFQQATHLFTHREAEVIHPLAWVVAFSATTLLEVCYWVTMRTAKQQNSPALAADAMHYRIDGLTSLCATLALLLGFIFPEWSVFLDHFGAILIAVLMVILGALAAKANLDQLMDKTPDSEFFALVKTAAENVEGVLATEKVRIQLYGPDAHIDIDVEVDPAMAVEEAHRISQRVRVEIQKAWPQVRDVTVHIEPYYPGDH